MKESAHRPDGWNPEVLDHALVSCSVPRVHAAYGQGRRYPLGDPEAPAADLEVFPMARVVRLTSPATQITLFDQDPPVPTEEGLIFHHSNPQEQRSVVLSAHGEVSLFVTPNTLLPDVTPSGDRRDTEAQTLTPPEALAQPPAPEPSTQAPAAGLPLNEEKEQKERMVLRGTAANDPTLTRSPRNIPIATFGLRVENDEQTVYHNVVAFKERAHEVMEIVKADQALRVIGYRHLRAINGHPEPVEEVFAVSVRPDKTRDG